MIVVIQRLPFLQTSIKRLRRLRQALERCVCIVLAYVLGGAGAGRIRRLNDVDVVVYLAEAVDMVEGETGDHRGGQGAPGDRLRGFGVPHHGTDGPVGADPPDPPVRLGPRPILPPPFRVPAARKVLPLPHPRLSAPGQEVGGRLTESVCSQGWRSSTSMWRSSGTTSVCVPTNDGTPGRWKTVGVTMLDDIARDLSVLSPIADNDQLT